MALTMPYRWLLIPAGVLGIAAGFALYVRERRRCDTLGCRMAGSRVTLAVFDLVGREVRTLADGEWEPGRHSAMLTKVSSHGSALGAGVYFVRINAQSLASGRSFTSLRKMVILR